MYRTIVSAIPIVAIAACTSSSDPSPACANPGGPVTGAADTHCGAKVQPTSQASCYPDAGAGDDGGASNPYGPTLFGTEGDDDDCKYHVTWSVSAVCENSDVTFTVTATKKTDGAPLTGAAPRAEVYLNDKHPAPSTAQKPNEVAPGKYTVGPIRFDAPGQWTVRFHFFELCDDTVDNSPHGHAAFFVSVP
jgi:hypothetical protein